MPTTMLASGRLRKFIRQPDRYLALYGNFTLTPRDLEILRTVHRYRYLEARHIRALMRGSDQQITRRLQGLFHNRYLVRYVPHTRMRSELDPGAPVIAYGIDLQGIRALRANGQEGSAAELARWNKAHTRRTRWFLKHRLIMSDFRCALELAVRDVPHVTLLQWIEGDAAVRRVTVPGPGRRKIGLAPDAIFSIAVDGHQRHCFLEIDRGTEEHSRLVRKYRAYWWYLQSANFKERFPEHHRSSVLFLTTGERRMRNMLASLSHMPKPNRASHGGKRLFWFGCHRQLSLTEPQSVLYARWRTVAMADSGPCLVK